MKEEEKSNTGLSFAYAMSLASQLGFLVVSSIGGFILLGIWLDSKLGTTPFLVIGGIIAGIILTIYEVHHMIKPLIIPGKDIDATHKKSCST